SRRQKRRAVAWVKAWPRVSNRVRARGGNWACTWRRRRRPARVLRVCWRRRWRRWALDRRARRCLPILAIAASWVGTREVLGPRNSYKEARFLVSCAENWAQVELSAPQTTGRLQLSGPSTKPQAARCCRAAKYSSASFLLTVLGCPARLLFRRTSPERPFAPGCPVCPDAARDGGSA